MAVVQRSLFGAGFQIPEALAFAGKQLGLVLDPKMLPLHFDEVFPAEFSVVADAPELKAPVPQALVPADNVAVVGHRVVAHIQPPVIRPSKQGDLILLGFGHCRRPGEPAVWDQDVHALIVAKHTASRQVVELGQVRAAIPLDGQPGQLLQAPVVAAVRAPPLLHVKPGPQGRDKDVQRFLQKLRPELWVLFGLGRVVYHFLGPDALAPAGVAPLHDLGVGVVHLSRCIRFRSRDKHKDAVRLRPGHGAIEDLAAILHTFGAKPGSQVAAGGDADHQLIGVRLSGVLQNLVLLCALVGVHLIGNDDVCVKTVLLVCGAGQGVDGDIAVLPHVPGDAPLHVVVDDPQPSGRVIVHGDLQPAQVVPQKVKALQRLLQCAAHLVHLGAAAPLIQCNGPGQGGGEGGLNVFSRDKVQGLLKAPLLGARLVKAHHIEDDKLVVGQ